MIKEISLTLSALCLFAFPLMSHAGEPLIIGQAEDLAIGGILTDYPLELAAMLKHQSENQANQ